MKNTHAREPCESQCACHRGVSAHWAVTGTDSVRLLSDQESNIVAMHGPQSWSENIYAILTSCDDRKECVAMLPGARPQLPGARPQLPGARPAMPGSRPALPTDPAKAEPASTAQPQLLPGARPQLPGARPQLPGARPQLPGARPQLPGARPQLPGARPAVPAPQNDSVAEAAAKRAADEEAKRVAEEEARKARELEMRAKAAQEDEARRAESAASLMEAQQKETEDQRPMAIATCADGDKEDEAGSLAGSFMSQADSSMAGSPMCPFAQDSSTVAARLACVDHANPFVSFEYFPPKTDVRPRTISLCAHFRCALCVHRSELCAHCGAAHCAQAACLQQHTVYA